MSTWLTRFKPNKSTLPAAAIASALCGAALLGIWTPAQSPEAQISRFGEAIANTLANANAGRMLQQDKIQLAVIANQTAAYPEISGIAFYSTGNEILALSGNIDANTNATAQATLDDTITGYVAVAVDPRIFAPATRVGAWLLSLAVILLAPLVSLGVLQLSARGNRSLPIVSVPETAPATPQNSYCLIVNLYNQLALDGASRQQAASDAMAMASETCAIHPGLAISLTDRGVALLFDRHAVSAGQAICAAFLLMNLLQDYETQGEFRYFLTQAKCPDSPAELSAMSQSELAESLDLQEVMAVAALARPTALLASAPLYNDLPEAERNWCAMFSHPLLDDESSNTYLIDKLPEEHVQLVEGHADLILGFSTNSA